MKRAMPWSDDEVDVISSDQSSSEAEADDNDGTSNSPIEQPPPRIVPSRYFQDMGFISLLFESTNFSFSVRFMSSYCLALGKKATFDCNNGMLMKGAEFYQQYMKAVPVPAQWGSVIPFTSWMGLGRLIKQLYGQPLHYLTNVLLKRWDQLRFGNEDEDMTLDIIVRPCEAEATIWLIEEAHRLTTSSHHIAKLWLSDPMHDAFVDPIFPEL
ncbi:hypothetical protein SLEP1_g49816 [Rubroshorea leprosula]|uniref:Protein RDM1 n=1 Tax=Rubroshorea leprosula TaxID=152421 RepID=A0AAV5LYY6_9ROSI|nr:hypothetical protein SLEP1_g49816 [Rubroshorea leprosula]